MSPTEGATRNHSLRLPTALLVLLAVPACERAGDPVGTGGEEPERNATAAAPEGAAEEDIEVPAGAEEDGQVASSHGAAGAPESASASGAADDKTTDATDEPTTDAELPLELPAPPPFEVEDLRPGKGPPASPGDLALVRYRASLPTDETFSESGEEPYRFRLGSGVAILGLERGVEGMRPGGRRRLTIPAHLAWGQRGVKDAGSGEYTVPPGATVIFEVELVAIEGSDAGSVDGSTESDPPPAPADPTTETGTSPEADP